MSGAREPAVLVFELACLTEDRTGPEQHALLAMALKLDKARCSFSALNPSPQPPRFVAYALETYHPDEGRRVK